MNKAGLKRRMVDICKEIYRERLVRGREGNVSARVDKNRFLITPHGISLGFIKEKDILLLDKQGKVVDGSGEPSFETRLHKAIYNELADVEAIIHVHAPFATLLAEKGLPVRPLSFEIEAILGGTEVIPQTGPVITDVGPVVDALKRRNVVILKNHGTVAIGSLEEAFFLSDMLEEASKMTLFAYLIGIRPENTHPVPKEKEQRKTYELFSHEHIKVLVSSVNESEEIKEEAQDKNFTARIAMRLSETGEVYSFHFVQGKIVKTARDGEADFVFTGSADCWRSIFNGQLDTYVAATQNKLKIEGDLTELSKWYLPLKKVFGVWRQFPVS